MRRKPSIFSTLFHNDTQKRLVKPLLILSTFLLVDSVTGRSFTSLFGNDPPPSGVIPEEWQQSFQTIGGILEALRKAIHDEYPSRFPLFLNLSLLHLYHRTLSDRISRVLVIPKDLATSRNENFCEQALRFMKFSSCAYGAILGMMLGVVEKPVVGTKVLQPESYSDTAAICRRLNLNASDIIVTSLHHDSMSEMIGEVFQPRYFIAMDHANQAIVVSIKGTASVNDLAKDLVCHSVPFLDGEAHSGIKAAAEKVYEQAIGSLTEALEKFQGYKVVLCGHSLGGGTAILLKLLIHQKQMEGSLKIDPSVQIECFAYAPPPVFRGLLPEVMAEGIHTFVHHHDIVPRLSLGSVYHLFCELRSIDQLPLATRDRLKIISMELIDQLMNRKESNEKLKKAVSMVQEATDHPPIIVLENGDKIKFEPLQLTGSVYHLYKAKKRRKDPKRYTMIKTENNFFVPIRIYADCFINHHPNAYEEALENIVLTNNAHSDENSKPLKKMAFDEETSKRGEL